MLNVKEILEATNGVLLNGEESQIINDYKIDSREVNIGDFYIPLAGEKVDGHKFIVDVVKNGACGFFKSKSYDLDIKAITSINKDIIIVEVNDTLRALEDIGKYNRIKNDKMEVVAITGSVGKTSTRQMVATILSTEKNLLVTQKNMNGHIGLPIMALNMDKQDMAVLEAGIDFIGEMDILNEILLPSVAVITNVGTSHIGKMKNIENIYKEKTKIANNLRGKKILLLNKDDELLKNYKNDNVNIVYYSIDEAKNIKIADDYMEFDVLIYSKLEHVRINVIGNHNVLNAIVGIRIGEIYNISSENIIKGVAEYRNYSRRMERVELGNFSIIDDTYNASPTSTESGLISVNHLKAKRKIAVLADILELGEYSEGIHTSLGKVFKNLDYDIVIAYGDAMKNLVATATEFVKEIYYYKTPEEAEEKLRAIIKAGDIVYFKGSNAMRVDEIVENLKRDFMN